MPAIQPDDSTCGSRGSPGEWANDPFSGSHPLISPDRIRRGLTELVVVVVGVLIALSADRWVQELDERERRITQLTWIARDLQADSVMLTGAIEREFRRTRDAQYLLDSLETVAGPIPESEYQRVAWAFIESGWSTPQNFSTSTWSEMVAAGELSLIGDPGLRRALSNYYRSHAQLRESEEDREEFFQALDRAATRVRPFKPEEMVVERRTLQVTADEVARIREVVRSDPEIRGLISYAGAAGVSRVRLYWSIRSSIDRLLIEVQSAIES